MSGLSQFEALEAEFGELRDAFGSLVVARHRGEDVAGMDSAYGKRRVAFGALLAAHVGAAPTERPLLDSIASALSWMDEMEPVDGLAETGSGPAEEPDVAELRRHTFQRFGEVSEAVRVGSQTMDRITALNRLATEPDAAHRRAMFDALEPIWRTVDGDGGSSSPYRTLLRSSAARWARDGSPVEAAATALGLGPGSIETTLHEVLAAWRAVLDPGLVEPWDYRFATGAMDRRLNGLVTRERLRVINDEHLRSLGADPAVLGIGYDIEPRPGRPAIPTAFAIARTIAREAADGTWRAATPWVFATHAEGGLGNLEELLHESGHALHYAAIRARPALFDPPVADAGLDEAFADLLGWDVQEPAFQARHLGDAVGPREGRLGRYGWVMLDVCWALFEIELHRDPERSPNEVWAELTESGLGIAAHPELPWWAIRGQLIDGPGYMASYALSALVTAAIRARIREVRGDWLGDGGDPGWYSFVSEHLLRFGASRPAADVLRSFLGGPLTATPLLDDLAVAAG